MPLGRVVCASLDCSTGTLQTKLFAHRQCCRLYTTRCSSGRAGILGGMI